MLRLAQVLSPGRPSLRSTVQLCRNLSPSVPHRLPWPSLQLPWSGEAPKPTSSNTEVLNKVTAQLDDLKHQQNKLFAVVHIGGRQFKITPNDLIVVNQIEADIGDEIYLEKVLLAGSDDVTLIGKPLLSDELVRVKATVTEHTKTAKVIVFKKKRRKNYKRKHGHRQPVSVLRINNIAIDTQSKLN